MEIDLGNATDAVAAPGVSRDALERLDNRVQDAHERIATGREQGTHGYAALNLPQDVKPEQIRAAIEPLPTASSIILVGIGGSALGAATLYDALPTDMDLHVLDHVDPVALQKTLDAVTLEETVVHLVSRSGKTTETLANTHIIAEAMEAAGVDWTRRTIVTTGEAGPLRALATEHDLPVLDPPAGVPGRYSVLSSTSLPVAALCGYDIEGLLAGGQAAVNNLAPSLFESPAYAYGAISYALAVRGVQVNAMMPYAENLETFAEWFAQLWAESLGKDELGQIPARALGVTDQHSQLQLYRAGPRRVQVSFLTVGDRRVDRRVPETDGEAADGIAGRSLAEIGAAEFQGTEASLAAAGRPNVRIELERLDEHALGELLVSMEAACMLAGELFDMSTFDQPAVEWGKRATRALLRDETTEETREIAEKHELRVSGR